MNKTVILIAAIIAVSASVLFYASLSHNRYYITTTSRGDAYEVDRKTGKSWALVGTEKIEQDNPDISEKKLPPGARAKVHGYGGLREESFDGKVYNGSDWVVTRVELSVTAKEKDGSERWTRDFSARVRINPLETGRFSVLLVGEIGAELTGGIKEIYGFQRQ